MDWNQALNDMASAYVQTRTPAPAAAAPVATNPATGVSYTEGKPAPAPGVKGMLSNPLVLAGGAVAIGLIAFLVLRK